MLSHFVFVCFDDILIFSGTHDRHIEWVKLVLQRLLENKQFIKLEKCEFHSTEVSFLEFVVAQGRLQADPTKIRTMEEWPPPPSRKQLQRFLEFVTVYQRFFPWLFLTTSLFTWSPGANAVFHPLQRDLEVCPWCPYPSTQRGQCLVDRLPAP